MEVNEYIKIYDNCIDYKTLSVFLKYANTLDFRPAGVGPNNEKDMEIRNTFIYDINNNKDSLSEAHWHNYVIKTLSNIANNYSSQIGDVHIKTFEPPQLLKYKEGGFYRRHVDHFTEVPRTLSFIFLLNNDYEGGNLVFKLKKGDLRIEKKPNRIVVWPSNFIYPHIVETVTKGIRYSLVSWAL